MTVRSSWDAATLGLVRVNKRRLRKMAPVPNPIAKARLFEAALGRGGKCSQAEIAAQFGVTRQEVCQYLTLVKRLPVDVIRRIERESVPRRLRRLSLRRLLTIARVPTAAQRLKASRRLLRSLRRTPEFPA